MAFNGWLSMCPITISSSACVSASASVSAMPVLLVAANFPSTIFSTSAGCLSTGADIRFSTTSAGTDSLPREIVNINTSASILSLYVKVPIITKGATTTIWCFWNNPSASEPGKGDSAQLQLVWSNFYGVFNFQGVTSAWKGISDSSSQYTNMTVIGTPTMATGYASGLSAITLTSACGMTYNELVNFATTTNVTSFDFSFWINQNGATPAFTFGTGTNGILYGLLATGQFGVSWGLCCTTTSAIPATGWHYIHFRGVNGTYTCYVDGVNKTSNTGSAAATSFTTFGLGTTATTAPVSIGDFRMTRNINTPVDNIVTQYVNYSNPAAFATPGTTITQSVQVTLTFSGLITGTDIAIYQAGTTNLLAYTSATGTTYSYTYSYAGASSVDVQIFNMYYEPISYYNLALTSTSNTIPIQQVFDRVFVT